MIDDGLRLGQGFDGRVDKLGRPISSAQEIPRPVASGIGLLRVGTANSGESHPAFASETGCESIEKYGLGRSVVGGIVSADSKGETQSERRPMGICTPRQGAKLEPEIPRVFPEYVLRPSELVRLLNSTHLGAVTSERQIYRNRQKAPDIQVDGKYVCLVKYCAWMVLERHTPKAVRSKRRKTTSCITLGELRALLHQQDYRCALSGARLTPTNFALDHIVPVAMGGTFSIDNCQLVTKEVNRAKHTMSQEDFLEMCNNVSRHQASRGSRKMALIDDNRPLLGLMS